MTESFIFLLQSEENQKKRNLICAKYIKKQQKLWIDFKFREKPVDFTEVQGL